MRSRRASTRRRARPRQRALPVVAIAAVLAGVSLAGCARTVIVEPAQDAANPECADIMLTLPDEIAGEQARRTSSQGTKAWGDPSIAVLRCGVTPPGPTTDRGVSVSGGEWVSRPADDDESTAAATGRGGPPARAVLVGRSDEARQSVMAAGPPALADLEPEAECGGAEDAEG